MALTLALIGDRLRVYIPARGAGRTLALVTFIDSIGTGLFLAGAAIFFVRSIGLTAAQVGLCLSVGGAVGFATTVPIGVLGDRLGPRRLLVLVQLWRAACLVALVFVSGVVWFTAVVALMAVPLIAAGSAVSFSAIMLGDALSFVVAALILARVPLTRVAAVRRRSGFLAVLGSFHDWRYAGLASLNSVLTLHMTILVFGIPLWLIRATSAPAGLVAVLMVLNTVMAVVLQVPFSKH